MDGVLIGIVIALLVLVILSQFGLWTIQYQVVRQQGRLLLRLDELADSSIHLGDEPTRATLGVNGEQASPLPPAALRVGETVPSFRLPDLAGRLVDSQEFRGNAVLLIHWNPECGFCDMIAPDLARLGADLQRKRAKVVLVSHGTADLNLSFAARHRLEYLILLQDPSHPVGIFQTLGTPVAYHLDERGLVAAPLAIGADQVLHLVRSVVDNPEQKKRLPGERPLTLSRIERDGLKAGTPAPTFQLPEARGGTVALERYRGRRVLLVFTDPECGPCDTLAPDLVRVEREGRKSGLKLVVIGRGSAEANRRKAEQYGFEFPVALQNRWEISKAFGTFATPVGFLIDEKGVIEKNVAKGPDAIVALAQQALAIGVEGSR